MSFGRQTLGPESATGAAVQVREMRAGDEAAWDAYVLAHEHGSPFHLIAWKRSIEETFGYRPMYLVAERAGVVCGVLPLFRVNTVLTGKILLSTPFAVYGGVLADTHEVLAAVRDTVARIARSERVRHVELRNAHEAQCVGWTRVPRYVTFTQNIDLPEDALLETIPRKTRRMVRKSLENGLVLERVDEQDAFEDLYHRSLRRLGTPSFPSRHFSNLRKHFGPMADLREVRSDGRAIAAVLTFYFRDQVLPYYGASDPAFNSLAPNNFMYFDLMRRAGTEGMRIFDFGRSKKGVAGSYDFKSHWGMMERELPYEMLLVKRKSVPNLSPVNPAFDLPIRIWQRLPLAVTKAVGPLLIRLVP